MTPQPENRDAATSASPVRGVVAVIPARLESTRLPRKPLIQVAGKALIQHVWERTRQARLVSRVIIATDSPEVLDHAQGFGAEVFLTRRDHLTGSDRIGGVLRKVDGSIILNVQGDEPEVAPEALDNLLRFFSENAEFDVATLATSYPESLDLMDTAAVKVVFTASGRALYFSRSPIPGHKGGPRADGVPHYLHMGVYAYRREALLRFLSLPPSQLEQTESLEQLRFLEHGMKVGVLRTTHLMRGIDTETDLLDFRARAEPLGGIAPQEKVR